MRKNIWSRKTKSILFAFLNRWIKLKTNVMHILIQALSTDMSKLFMLPEYYLVEVLSNWIETEQVVNFDTACCNNLIRTDLMRIFDDAGFVTRKSCAPINIHEINYLNLRNIKIGVMIVRRSHKYYILMVLQNLHVSRLTCLHVHLPVVPAFVNNFLSLVNSCVNLVNLGLYNQVKKATLDNFVSGISLTILNQLTRLKIISSVMHHECSWKLLSANCLSLQNIRINCNAMFYENHFHTFISKYMVSIRVCPITSHVLPDSIFHLISSTCALLKILKITTASESIPLKSITSIIMNCLCLRELCVSGTLGPEYDRHDFMLHTIHNKNGRRSTLICCDRIDGHHVNSEDWSEFLSCLTNMERLEFSHAVNLPKKAFDKMISNNPNIESFDFYHTRNEKCEIEQLSCLSNMISKCLALRHLFCSMMTRQDATLLHIIRNKMIAENKHESSQLTIEGLVKTECVSHPFQYMLFANLA